MFETLRGVVDSTWTRPPGPRSRDLAVALEARGAAVDEVQLVLRVVVVEEALHPGRVDDRVDAEGGDAERRPHLAEAVTVAELVDRAETVCHRAPPVGCPTLLRLRGRFHRGSVSRGETSWCPCEKLTVYLW